jgi:hypothetical protein
MPYRDHTGPSGQGPMTGRRMGDCRTDTEPPLEPAPAYGYGRRVGRGPGRGRGRRLFGRTPRRMR